MSENDRKLPPHWYRIYIEQCVICGKTNEDRERIYGKRPKDPAKRYVYVEFGCSEHFA